MQCHKELCVVCCGHSIYAYMLLHFIIFVIFIIITIIISIEIIIIIIIIINNIIFIVFIIRIFIKSSLLFLWGKLTIWFCFF